MSSFFSVDSLQWAVGSPDSYRDKLESYCRKTTFLFHPLGRGKEKESCFSER